MDKRKSYLNLVNRIEKHDAIYHPQGFRVGEQCKLRSEIEDLVMRGRAVPKKTIDDAEELELKSDIKSVADDRFDDKKVLSATRKALESAGIEVPASMLEESYEGDRVVRLDLPDEMLRGLVDERGVVSGLKMNAYTAMLEGKAEQIAGYLRDNGYPEASVQNNVGEYELEIRFQ